MAFKPTVPAGILNSLKPGFKPSTHSVLTNASKNYNSRIPRSNPMYNVANLNKNASGNEIIESYRKFNQGLGTQLGPKAPPSRTPVKSRFSGPVGRSQQSIDDGNAYMLNKQLKMEDGKRYAKEVAQKRAAAKQPSQVTVSKKMKGREQKLREKGRNARQRYKAGETLTSGTAANKTVKVETQGRKENIYGSAQEKKRAFQASQPVQKSSSEILDEQIAIRAAKRNDLSSAFNPTDPEEAKKVDAYIKRNSSKFRRKKITPESIKAREEAIAVGTARANRTSGQSSQTSGQTTQASSTTGAPAQSSTKTGGAENKPDKSSTLNLGQPIGDGSFYGQTMGSLRMARDNVHDYATSNGGYMSTFGRHAATGAVWGAGIGGTVSAAQGGDFWAGAKEGAFKGAVGYAGYRGVKAATKSQGMGDILDNGKAIWQHHGKGNVSSSVNRINQVNRDAANVLK